MRSGASCHVHAASANIASRTSHCGPSVHHETLSVRLVMTSSAHPFPPRTSRGWRRAPPRTRRASGCRRFGCPAALRRSARPASARRNGRRGSISRAGTGGRSRPLSDPALGAAAGSRDGWGRRGPGRLRPAAPPSLFVISPTTELYVETPPRVPCPWLPLPPFELSQPLEEVH